MSLFRRNEIWYASYSLPGGKRIKESLGTKDKRQAQELHDKRKAELWRVEKLGDLPDVTFEEACLRWLEEKADKKSLDSDKSRIEFWLEHFEGIRLKDISEAKIYSAVSRMHNRKTKEIWKQKVQAAIRKGKELPVYEPKPVSTQTSEQMEHQRLRSGRCASTARHHGYQLVVVQELKISVSMTSDTPGQAG